MTDIDDEIADASAAEIRRRRESTAAMKAAQPSDARREAAARLIGMKPSEVTGVDNSPQGVVITTCDSQRFVVVPDEQPDAEGKVGVMYLEPPSTGMALTTEEIAGTRWNGFPVYAPDEGRRR